ncbi:hypothetical protein CDAR_4581 [Caerostris darwini]|uniref:Uncharacterized protein n=1 Tax=Caerostris darwini TaxID=1538125 RepID=A0AAV4SMN1_9ARAC|nr:hypothetical protein CDAR_4581 [Caerostris darwini]
MTRTLKSFTLLLVRRFGLFCNLVSNAHKKKTPKFMSKLDGPYVILTQRSPVSNEVANLYSPDTPIGKYHVSPLKPFVEVETTPIAPLMKRGRPKKSDAVSSTSYNLKALEKDVMSYFL